MNNVLVTGANGQLGSEIRALSTYYPGNNFMFTDFSQLDITNHADVKNFIEVNNTTVIINCAAYTAVDKAESDEVKANEINNLAVQNMAKIAKKKNVKLIHISTDYVFDGNGHQPYKEDDLPNPQNVYGKTKLEGEQAMQMINPDKSIIIRTSWVYSSFGANFVKTMLRLGSERNELGIIADQIGTPTYARDLARTILDILPKLENKSVEVYHFSNEGVCSWYDFAKAIFESEKTPIKVSPIETIDYPTPATRPFYSLMNKRKIKETFELDIPYWKDSLKVCLQHMRELVLEESN